MNLDPSLPPLSREAAREDLLRDLIAQGIRLIGVYGWTWVDWHQLAQVRADVLHQALQGRLTDLAGCEQLVTCLGMELVADADGILRLGGYQVPRERLRASPTKTTACLACGRRGQLAHRPAAAMVLLVCGSCGDERAITLDLVRW